LPDVSLLIGLLDQLWTYQPPIEYQLMINFTKTQHQRNLNRTSKHRIGIKVLSCYESGGGKAELNCLL